MLQNYFTIAWRNLLKNKTFSVINVIGLAFSMSVCLMIISVIADYKRYDQFHVNKDRIYLVTTAGKNNNADMNKMASSALPLSGELRQSYSGIEAAAGLVRGFGGDIFYQDKVASGGGYYADDNLFKVLDFNLLQGDPNTALQNPRSIVIAEELAKQLFYNENPIGKTVSFKNTGLNPLGIDNGNRETDYGLFTITGILQPNAGKTHLPFKVLASISTIQALRQDSIVTFDPLDWNNIFDSYTYVLLQQGQTEADLKGILTQVSGQKYPNGNNDQYAFSTLPLTQITPGQALGNMTHLHIPGFVLMILGGLCLVVMLSACLNYANLSIARSLTRAKEVGIRKVSGAARGQIFGQFIAESIVISMVSLLFSVLILFGLQALFTNLSFNKYLNITFEHSAALYLIFIGFSIGVGVIAGLLPAAYISAFSPIQILKNINSVKLFRHLTARKVLLTAQFCMSLVFIITTVLIYLQTRHVFNFDYGFDQENIVNVTLYNNENYDRFAHAIEGSKDVLAVSACMVLPATGSQFGQNVKKTDGTQDSTLASYIDIDAKCLDVWGLTLIAGNNLPEKASTTGEKHLLVNETFVQKLNLGSPTQAVGQRILIGENNVEISGVVKDFHFLNLNRSGIEPLMLRNRQSQLNYATIKISGTNTAATVQFLSDTWKSVNPKTKFEYEFFDQQLLTTHTLLSNMAGIIGFIAFLVVLISCLGLLGMAAYTAETRQKEIGIRRVLGSGTAQIIYLLSKNYIVLIAIAIVIAIPIAITINKLWLDFFVSRVSIGPAVLLFSVFVLLCITFLTILSQSWRAARINPVESLRSE